MYDDLMPFESVAEMRCAVLEAQPSGLADETRKWVVRAIEAIRQDNCFEFGDFDLNAEKFLRNRGTRQTCLRRGLASPAPTGVHRFGYTGERRHISPDDRHGRRGVGGLSHPHISDAVRPRW